MERITSQKWLLLVANLQLVIGIVWGRFWSPAVYICITIWVVLVVAGFALRKRTSN